MKSESEREVLQKMLMELEQVRLLTRFVEDSDVASQINMKVIALLKDIEGYHMAMEREEEQRERDRLSEWRLDWRQYRMD